MFITIRLQRKIIILLLLYAYTRYHAIPKYRFKSVCIIIVVYYYLGRPIGLGTIIHFIIILFRTYVLYCRYTYVLFARMYYTGKRRVKPERT